MQNPLMLSNFGLSSKSQNKNYDDLDEPKKAYSESFQGDDGKRI
jgi:hypothetical protein